MVIPDQETVIPDETAMQMMQAVNWKCISMILTRSLAMRDAGIYSLNLAYRFLSCLDRRAITLFY